MRTRVPSLLLTVFLLAPLGAQHVPFDDRPAGEGEWGFRPQGEPSVVDPPAFSWRPQEGASRYELQVSRDPAFATLEYEASDPTWNVHAPTRTLGSGEHHWRVRAVDARGKPSAWSRVRSFAVAADARPFPLPPRDELIARIPRTHPRLFVRPEDRAALRARLDGDLRPAVDALRARAARDLAQPPEVVEPPRYPPGTVTKSEAWREIWWGNRTRTIAVLERASTLAFLAWLDDDERCAREARRLLLAAATWDPRGATGYRYNDEAGMPYAYYFARTYTFLHARLSEAEREACRRVMRVRGKEMADHLVPRHLWRPWSSHANRAWHFLGEVGVAFLGEIEGAEEWVWFALNVFRCVYPVWSDEDGGWHEGIAYWRSYLERFTWWADVLRSAMDVDAYALPFFARAGDFALYVQPPHTRTGGFGDLAFHSSPERNADLMRIFAAQAGNGAWQRYVREVATGPPRIQGFVDFLRAALPAVPERPLEELAPSRVFRGIGLACLNTTLADGRENVAVLFKSSPFGTQSHGYEAQNAFQLVAFGEPLLIRTGRRDVYGSDHHRDWMWNTISVNSLLVDGAGQGRRTAAAQGRIVHAALGRTVDVVVGEAAAAYGGRLERFRRTLVFAKPDWLFVLDDVRAKAPATFQWMLHAPTPMTPLDDRAFDVASHGAAVRVSFLHPADLAFTQTDRFEPPPRERIRLVQHHLTAATREPLAERRFVVAAHPHRAGAEPLPAPHLTRTPDGFTLRATCADGELVVWWSGDVPVVERRDASGATIERLE